MLTEEPIAESDAKPARPGLWFRRMVLILGGAVIVCLGVALSTAFAHPASASPLPASFTTVAHGAVPTPVVSITKLTVPGSTGAQTAVSGAVSAVTSPVVTTARAAVAPMRDKVTFVTGPVVSMLSTDITASGLVPAMRVDHRLLPAAPAIAHRSVVTSELLRVAAVHLGGVGPAHAAPLRSSMSAARISPALTPLRSFPAQLPPLPLTASAPNDSSSPGQGNNPFGAFLPTSLLLSALISLGVFVWCGTTPSLLVDKRYASPG